MHIWLDAVVRPGKSGEEVRRKREEWINQGKEKLILEKCKSAQRFGVIGSSPQRVFWLIETEDESISKLISEHFGDVWEIKTYKVNPQSIGAVLKEVEE